MQSRILAVGLVIMLTAQSPVYAQYSKQEKEYKKCFVGSTLAMLGNFSSKNKPVFFNSILVTVSPAKT